MKLSLHLSLFLLLSIFTISSLRFASAACHVDDEAGLLGFKLGITHDPTGMLSSWIKGTDCCTWNGVNCDPDIKRVTVLNLQGGTKANEYLSGTVSPLLAKIKFLGGIYFLDLKFLSGKFPDVFFSLPNIVSIYLVNNNFSGQLPTNIGSLLPRNFFDLGLTGNRFTGPIPSSLSNLTAVAHLTLGSNQLTGTIPSEINNLKSLLTLSLENNRFSGSIPDMFSPLTQLSTLDLSYNNFSGQIPTSIKTSDLFKLKLSHNSLSGPIPEFLGNFNYLNTLDLSWNKFSGVVPKSFANLTSSILDLSHNQLVDPFPELKVTSVGSLDLSYNNFQLKEIPNWVTQSSLISSLKLAKCGIKMDISNWAPASTTYYNYYYKYIDLSENEISGSPIKLLNKTANLRAFTASGNKLKFDLEKVKFASTLKNLDLSRNLVYGKVPSSVTGLRSLNVSYNQLCGQLPKTNFSASSFVGNACLCGAPLSQSCTCTCGK